MTTTNGAGETFIYRNSLLYITTRVIICVFDIKESLKNIENIKNNKKTGYLKVFLLLLKCELEYFRITPKQ